MLTSTIKGNASSHHLLSIGFFLQTNLVEERVISSSDSGPVRLSTYIHLNHWLDVVARQLSTLDNPDTDLNIERRSEAAEPTVRTFTRLIYEKVPLIYLGWQKLLQDLLQEQHFFYKRLPV